MYSSYRFSGYYRVYSTVLGTRSVDVVVVVDGATVTVDVEVDSADAACGSCRLVAAFDPYVVIYIFATFAQKATKSSIQSA